MDLVKNLIKSYYIRCSTDVRSFLIARASGHFRTSDTSTTETFLRMSGTLRTSDTFTSEAFLRMSGPARTSVSCTLDCGSHFSQRPVVRWLSDVRTHLGLRTSDHLVPQTVTFSHHLYIYPSLPRDRVDHSLWASQEHSSLSLSFIHTKS